MSRLRNAIVIDGRLKKAEKFFTKFGYGILTIEQFDMFIIDNKWAKDPKTDDKADPRHKVFVTERARQKRALDAAGPFLTDNPFQIAVKTKGAEWEIEEWNTNAREIARDVGNRVSNFANARLNQLRKLSTRASEMKALTKEGPEKDALAETIIMIAFMADKSIELQTNVEAQCKRFNKAADAVEAQVKGLLEKATTDAEDLKETG